MRLRIIDDGKVEQMRIVVTGGNGRIGHYAVRELVAAGHRVTNLDLLPPVNPVPGVHNMRGNVTNIADIYGAVAYARADGVAHLAAWADPGIVADARTYSENVTATYNVLDVCFNLGVKRVLVASSAQVYGFASHAPVYAPVDEDHPLRPVNSYALGKVAGEDAALNFAKKGLSVLALRILGARIPEDIAAEIEAVKKDPAQDRMLLWTRTDSRDIATGCRQALERETVPSGVYNLTAARNVLGVPTRDLLAQYYPETEMRAGLMGDRSALSIAKAQAAFGYEPRFG
jgi:nucleoside-diphosphate-sugar epimerase